MGMDFLELLVSSFPELRHVVRNGQLPYALATDPSALTCWLLLMRSLVDLERFSYVLAEVYESFGSDLCIAKFADSGPPVIGCPEYIEQIASCEAPILVLNVPPDFDLRAAALRMHPSTVITQLITSPPTVVFERSNEQQDVPLRYLPELHGKVLVHHGDVVVPHSRANECIEPRLPDGPQSTVTDAPACDNGFISEQLLELWMIDSTTDDDEILTHSCTDESVPPSDVATSIGREQDPVDSSWKWRPNIPK